MTKAGFALVLYAGSALIGGAAPSSAALPTVRLAAPGQVGTVDTVAGPGFCAGPATPDVASKQVGDLAADGTGMLWFESGRSDSGVVTKVINSAAVLVTRSGVDGSKERGSDDEKGRRPTASRLAADGGGGLLIAASTAVLRLSEGLATVAGSRSAGETGRQVAIGGDGGPLREAQFANIRAIASDSSGNVYLADEVDQTTTHSMVIRFLNRSDQPVTFYRGTAQELTVAAGSVDTIAGGPGTLLGQAVRGPGPIAEVTTLAVAGQRLYLSATPAASPLRAVVQMINLGGDDVTAHGGTVPAGRMATVANVAAQSRTPGGVAMPIASPLPGIAADDEGNLFLAERAGHRVRRVDPAGLVTTVAGTGVAGFNGNDQPATEARLHEPYDVAVGPGGRVFISDSGNGQVRVVDRAGTIRATLGNGATSGWACAPEGTAGPRLGATVGSSRGGPVSLAADDAGNVYVAASELAQVHRLVPSGSLSPVAGRSLGSCADAAGCPVDDHAMPTDTALAEVAEVAAGPAGGLYVLENGRAWLLNLSRRPIEVQGASVPPGAIRTIAGRPPSAAAAHSTTSPLGAPRTPDAVEDRERAAQAGSRYTAMVGDPMGNLLLAEMPNGEFDTGSVQQVDHRGVVTTLVDRPTRGRDGTSDTSRCCPAASDLVTDDAGNVYIADVVTRRVWFLNRSVAPVVVQGVSVAPGAIEPVAGAGSAGTQDEGISALEAHLSRPSGIALDQSGNLYVSDLSRHSVHRVDVRGIITTVVGTGQLAFNGDGLKGQLTALNQPADVVVDACGNLLVADNGNDRVRRLNMVASCPSADAGAEPGGSRHPLTAVVAPLGALAMIASVAAALGTRHVRRRKRRRLRATGRSAEE